MSDIIEEQTDVQAVKFQEEISGLKAEILKNRVETEEAILKKNMKIAELEREVLQSQSLTEKISIQERQIKELEQGMEVKAFLILNKEREVARIKQRLDEMIMLNAKLKQANQA